MKQLILKAAVLIVSIAMYSGCNSTMYEIIEVEEPVEIKEETAPVTDIKEDTKEDVAEVQKEEPKTENKFSDKQMVSKTFAIQIGAFNDEKNASSFTNESINSLNNTEIYYKSLDGLYKVRLGSFNDKENALSQLETVKSQGFNDAFLVELTYYRVEK